MEKARAQAWMEVVVGGRMRPLSLHSSDIWQPRTPGLHSLERKYDQMPAASRPWARENAIEAATFVVSFPEPLNQQMAARVRIAIDALADELPGLQDGPQGMFVAFGAGPVPPPPPVDYLRFVAAPNGQHQWRAQVVANTIQVGCFEYTRFDAVWERAERYLITMLNALNRDQWISEIGLQVNDKFLYPAGMPPAEYDPAELYQQDSPLLTKKSQSSGIFWHLFQGWFDSDHPNRILNQLNVSNTPIAPGNQLAALIEHKATFQVNPEHPINCEQLMLPADGPRLLETTFRKLHTANKTVLKQLLTPEKLRQINMEVG